MELLAALGKDGPFWGGIGTASYALLLALHIVALVMAFGPMLVVGNLVKPGAAEGLRSARRSLLTMVLPGLLLSLVTGIALVLNSNEVFSMGAPWISTAFTLLFVLLGLSIWLIRILGKASSSVSGDEVASAVRNVLISTGLFHLSLVVMVVLMIWKPGQ